MLRPYEHTVNAGENGTVAAGLIAPSVTDGQPYRSAYGYTASSNCGHGVSLYVVRNGRQLYTVIRERKVPCKRGFDYDEHFLSYREYRNYAAVCGRIFFAESCVRRNTV